MQKVTENYSPVLFRLFEKYHYQVSVSSVLEDTLSGIVFVDDLKTPKSGLLLSQEGAFIAGDSSNKEFNSKMSLYLEQIIHSGTHPIISDTDDLWFYIDDPKWEQEFHQIFTSRTPFKVGRQHYTQSLPAKNWRHLLQDGFQVFRADNELSIDTLNFPKDVWGWVEDDLNNYLESGFGAVLTQGKNLVSWSNADCASGDRCEIGIITTEGERRKGFGALTVLAALDFCYQSGFKTVGWHCEAHNWGSIATAKKVGFKKKTEYYAWVCKFDLEQHIKEKKIVEKYYP